MNIESALYTAREKSLKPDNSWYALYTKPRAEFKAAQQLLELRIEHYLPVITKVKQWSDRKKKIVEPLMRGYIFIYANEKERMLSLEQYSIIRCVFDQGRPAKIPGWQIENIKTMLSSDSNVFIHEGLIPGKKVLIKNGPFEGVIGVIKNTENGKNSIAVSIDLLNRSILAHLPRESDFEILKEDK